MTRLNQLLLPVVAAVLMLAIVMVVAPRIAEEPSGDLNPFDTPSPSNYGIASADSYRVGG